MKNTTTLLILTSIFCSPAYAGIEIEEPTNSNNVKFTTLKTRSPHNQKFIVQEGNGTHTRNSIQPNLDKEGYLVDRYDGKYILGLANDPLFFHKRIKVNKFERIYVPTNHIKIDLNLPSTDLEQAVRSDKITIYDPFSAERTLHFQWKKYGLQTWTFGFFCDDVEEITFNDSTSPFPFKFDTKGDSESPFDQLLIKWKPSVSSIISTISLKESVVTAKGEEFSFSNTQDGKSSGKFKSLKYLFDGQVVGVYKNNYEKTVGTLALIDSY